MFATESLGREKRDTGIQGYADSVFWERNSLNYQKPRKERKAFHGKTLELFNA